MSKIPDARFDVTYHSNHASLDYHYCREWDGDNGCYGTNMSHGLSFEDACAEIAKYHERQAKLWKDHEHYSCLSFLGETNGNQG